MKLLIVTLMVLGVWLQYKLWFAADGIAQTVSLTKSITELKQENKTLQDHNVILQADVKDLKTGNEAIEERARSELGMVKNGEVFYQVVD